MSVPRWICIQVCQFWSRSVQWFATGPSVTATVSSGFSRCWRWLAQKHAKKQHLYVNNYNSGPNMLTVTSLPFFTAIFLAFRGLLAEVINGNVPACNDWIIYRCCCWFMNGCRQELSQTSLFQNWGIWPTHCGTTIKTTRLMEMHHNFNID